MVVTRRKFIGQTKNEISVGPESFGVDEAVAEYLTACTGSDGGGPSTEAAGGRSVVWGHGLTGSGRWIVLTSVLSRYLAKYEFQPSGETMGWGNLCVAATWSRQNFQSRHSRLEIVSIFVFMGPPVASCRLQL